MNCVAAYELFVLWTLSWFKDTRKTNGHAVSILMMLVQMLVNFHPPLPERCFDFRTFLKDLKSFAKVKKSRGGSFLSFPSSVGRL